MPAALRPTIASVAEQVAELQRTMERLESAVAKIATALEAAVPKPILNPMEARERFGTYIYNPKLITVMQLARALQVSRSVVYDRVANGRIPKPITKPGEIMHWSRADIEKWINKRRLPLLPKVDE
ncbi:MAG: hypothetical protein QM775_27875 [Pirellulales bacterium]